MQKLRCKLAFEKTVWNLCALEHKILVLEFLPSVHMHMKLVILVWISTWVHICINYEYVKFQIFWTTNIVYEFVSMFSPDKWFALYIVGILWQDHCMLIVLEWPYIPKKCWILPCNQKNQATLSKRHRNGVWYVFIRINYHSKSVLSLPQPFEKQIESSSTG
jgi:hypothetical protein